MLCTLRDATAPTTTADSTGDSTAIREEGWLLFSSLKRDTSLLKRVPGFVLSRKTEDDGAPKIMFFMPKLRIMFMQA